MIQSTIHSTRPPAVLAVLAACAVSLTAAILYIGFGADEALTGADTLASTTIRVGQGVPAVFGAMAVERVERHALKRPGPGERLDVTVAIINLKPTALPVASADVVLRGADGKVRPGSTSADTPAFVSPRGAIRATFSFVLPKASSALQIELSDQTMARPAIVELGQSAAIPILKELDAPPHSH